MKAKPLNIVIVGARRGKTFVQSVQSATANLYGVCDRENFFVLREFVNAINERHPPDIDVYDAISWSSIIPLSAFSIPKGKIPLLNFQSRQEAGLPAQLKSKKNFDQDSYPIHKKGYAHKNKASATKSPISNDSRRFGKLAKP